jgi:hypothetical protein
VKPLPAGVSVAQPHKTSRATNKNAINRFTVFSFIVFYYYIKETDLKSRKKATHCVAFFLNKY